ncbi:MAG: DinB family protein [Acidobacteriota bacterium]
MDGQHFLDETRRQYRKLEQGANKALAQLSDDSLFVSLGEGSNSLAILMKHMAGNMRSRWTDFLTSDGEKPDRNRDSEFVIDAEDTADSIRERWRQGWQTVHGALDGLAVDDLGKTVTIRNEPHTVPQAMLRQLSHYSYHVGQITFLARRIAGDGWRFLSIAPGKSKEFDATQDGMRYLEDPPRS